MNWTYWSGQGADLQSGKVLGAVSIGADIFKAVTPLVISWAWVSRSRLAVIIGSILLIGTVIFSFVSALGFASSSRAAVTANREARTWRYAAVDRELGDIKEQLVSLGAIRSQSVIQEALERAKQDRRWTSSSDCKDATVEASRTFCRGRGDLRMERASAELKDQLHVRQGALQSEFEHLLKDGARHEQDEQAGILSRLSGASVERVQSALTLLFALVVEFGAAFGLFLAMVPMNGSGLNRPISVEVVRFPAEPQKLLGPPTRFVRGPDGRLMIE